MKNFIEALFSDKEAPLYSGSRPDPVLDRTHHGKGLRSPSALVIVIICGGGELAVVDCYSAK